MPSCCWNLPRDRPRRAGMAPYPGQVRCLALGFCPECFRRLNVKGGRRPFPKETRSALDIEGKHVTIQRPSPGLSPAAAFAPSARATWLPSRRCCSALASRPVHGRCRRPRGGRRDDGMASASMMRRIPAVAATAPPPIAPSASAQRPMVPFMLCDRGRIVRVCRPARGVARWQARTDGPGRQAFRRCVLARIQPAARSRWTA